MKIVHEIEIDAPPDIVWELLTEPTAFTTWMATTAELDLRPDGELRWTHDNGHTVEGRYLEIENERRLVFTYGWADGWLDVPAGSTTVEILLDPIGIDGTRLRLTHRGLEGPAAEQHLGGWRHFLGLLVERTADQRLRGEP